MLYALSAAISLSTTNTPGVPLAEAMAAETDRP